MVGPTLPAFGPTIGLDTLRLWRKECLMRDQELLDVT